jgi:hypothetical protein
MSGVVVVNEETKKRLKIETSTFLQNSSPCTKQTTNNLLSVLSLRV